MQLALSMGGSMLVGIAEVVVYSGYIRRVGEAKGKERAMKVVKEVVNTWVVGPETGQTETEGSREPVTIESKDEENFRARRRK